MKALPRLMMILAMSVLAAGPSAAQPPSWAAPERAPSDSRPIGSIREGGAVPITAQDRKQMNVSAAVGSALSREGIKPDQATVDVSADGGRVTITFKPGVQPGNPVEFFESVRTTFSSRNIRAEAVVVMSSADGNTTKTLRWSEDAVRIEGEPVKGVRVDEVAKNTGVTTRSVVGTKPGAASPREQAKAIIISHLQEIKLDGKMSRSIALQSYWKGVFETAKRPDLLETAMPLLKTAINAGVAPLQEKGAVSAGEFADLAIAALGGPTQPAASGGAPAAPRGTAPAPVATGNVVPLPKLGETARAESTKFGKTTLVNFAVALFNQRGTAGALADVARSPVAQANPAIAKGFQSLVALSADPVKNADAIGAVAGTLNTNLHAIGLHVEVNVIQDGEGNAATMVVGYQITATQSVGALGHDNPTLVIAKIGDTNLFGGTLGHHREGEKVNFLNGPSTDEHSASVFTGLTAGQPLVFSMPTNTGRAPVAGLSLPREARQQVAAADTALRAVVPEMKLPAFQTLYRESVAKHEAFHGSFEARGGRARVKVEAERIIAGGTDHPLAPIIQAVARAEGREAAINLYAGAVDEQGAYLHQIAASDPRIAPVLVAELVNRSLGGGGDTTTIGTRLAVLSLQRQLPNVPQIVAAGADPRAFINDLQPANFAAFFRRTDSKALQTAASNAVRDDLIKPYVR